MSETAEKLRVERSFHRGACEYDSHVPVQQRVIEVLADKVAALESLPEGGPVLDIGCGTGRLLEILSRRIPAAELLGVDLAEGMLAKAKERLGHKAVLLKGDAEALPINDASCALVLSSSTFQWLKSLNGCFSEVHRSLMPGGRFCFAMFGGETFYHLKESWRFAMQSCGYGSAGDSDGTQSFFSAEEVFRSLKEAGFSDLDICTTHDTVYYEDLPHLLQAVKRIGAGSSRPLKGGGLGWRRVLHVMADYYQKKYGTQQGVPAFYEIIWGTARRQG